MQDQPRYEAFEPGDKKTFPDGQSARPLVEGTVPRGGAGQEYIDRKADYFYTGQLTSAQGASAPQTSATPAATGSEAAPNAPNAGMSAGGAQAGANAAQGIVREGGPDIFPVQVTIDASALERGRDRYNNFCAMCHGMTGEGDGMVVRRGYQRPPSLVGEPGLQSGQASAAHFFRTITNGQGAMPSYADMLPPEDRWKIVAYIRALQMTRNRPASDVPESERQKLGNAGQTGGQPAGEQH